MEWISRQEPARLPLTTDSSGPQALQARSARGPRCAPSRPGTHSARAPHNPHGSALLRACSARLGRPALARLSPALHRARSHAPACLLAWPQHAPP